MDRDGLADFLRRRRTQLAPDAVGLPDGARRRTPGLRREEVALLAAMSPDFYTRLEQRRGPRPSEETVAALADALRLTRDERDHLFALTGRIAPPRAVRSERAGADLLNVLATVSAPALIISDLGVTLAQNAHAEALLGVQTRETGHRRSIMYRWFTDPSARRIYPADDHPLHARAYVGMLRTAHGAAPDDPAVRELVDRLLRESAEFAALWAQHDVGRGGFTRKRFVHPAVGLVTLDCQVITGANVRERLLVLTARAGSEDERRLAELACAAAGAPQRVSA